MLGCNDIGPLSMPVTIRVCQDNANAMRLAVMGGELGERDDTCAEKPIVNRGRRNWGKQKVV
eukprot:scaffold17633_cov18-Tisochrysis_lutea.AAC.1